MSKQETSEKFTVKTKTPEIWRTVIQALSTLVEEASFTATPEGIGFRAMDPSHVALIDLDLPASNFEKYECEETLKITVRTEDFSRLMRRADREDSVELNLRKADDLLEMKMRGDYDREFQIHLIEATYGETPLPKLNFNSKIVLTQQGLSKLIEDMAVVGDHVTIEASAQQIVFTGKSDHGSGTATLHRGNESIIELKVKEDSRATYSIAYIQNILKAVKSEQVTLEHASKTPLRLTFQIGDTGRLDFYLAPRIEEK